MMPVFTRLLGAGFRARSSAGDPMRIDVITLFPAMFHGPFEESMIRIARQRGLVDLRVHDLRDFSREPHRKVDDRPYGGGPGMVIMPDPVFRAIEAITAEGPEHRDAEEDTRGNAGTSSAERTGSGAVEPLLVLLTPQGRTWSRDAAWEASRERHLVVLCGHYEGFDERIHEAFPFVEVSIGDYVLTGGEIPAMVLVDSVVRLVPGVVGDPESLRRDSFEGELLDHPHYTRPPVYRGLAVPEVLRSGDHAAIDSWREERARTRTAASRPGGGLRSRAGHGKTAGPRKD